LSKGFNPCDGVLLSKNHDAGGFQPVFLSARPVETLVGQLDLQASYDLLVRFAAYTALRAPELTGLRIRDLNLKAGHVEVCQTMQHIKGEWITGTPKSARSTRNVPLISRALVDELREHLLAHRHSGDPGALVWPGRNPGSHSVTYEPVFDAASYRRDYLKPAPPRLKKDDGMRFPTCATRSQR